MTKRYRPALAAICLFAIVCCGCGQQETGDPADGFSAALFGNGKGAESEIPLATLQPIPISTPTPTFAPEVTPEPEPEPTPEVVTFTISAAGDVSLGNLQIHSYEGSFAEMYDQKGPAYFFRNVKDIFEADDMTIVNFEGVLTSSEDLVEKDYNIKGDPEYIAILPQGSVEAVSFGNNHRMDYGKQGSDDTVALFQENGIAYAYNGNFGLYEAKGIRVGFLSVNVLAEGAGVEKWLKKGIGQFQEEGVDLIVACCHWGTERENYPGDYQQQLGKKCIDWGADLVIGCHPHVLQGVQVYKGRFIVHSLGNFCFGGNKNPQVKETMIFQQTFTFVEGVRQEDMNARIVPCFVSSVKNRNDFCPTPAEGEDFRSIIGDVNTWSEPFGVVFGEDGSYQAPGSAAP